MRKIFTVLMFGLVSAGVAAAAPSPSGGSTSGQPVIVASDTMRALLTHVVNPVYPPAAQAAGTTGTVVLNVVIDTTGAVINDAVASGSDPFASSAVAAVNNWTYKPYLLNGSAVQVQTTVTVTFSLGK